MKTIKTLYYQTRVNDKKHNLSFLKDKLSYGGLQFDLVLSNMARKNIEGEMKSRSIAFPIEIALGEGDYFLKPKSYIKADGSKGVKTKVVILSYQALEQGHFDSRTLDDAVEEIRKARSVSEDGEMIEVSQAIAEAYAEAVED